MNDWERLQQLSSQKDKLRTQMRQQRDAIPEEKRKEESQILFQMITQTELYLDAKWIISYVSFGSEVDTHELIRRSLKDGKRVYVPRIDNIEGRERMHFFELLEDSKLTPNAMGIMEPEEDPGHVFPYDLHLSLDKAQDCVFFVPGLAFDKSCHRLGYGKGYYDRFLSRFDKKMTVGLSYTEQIVEEVPADDHDIALDLVVTPQGAFY